MPMLEVESLTVRYGRLEAVREASFQVDAGQIVALIGSNGAGKSSSLKAVIGLARAASGRIRLDGRDVTGMAPAARVAAGLALSPEGRRLFGRMSVQDNLLTGAHGVRDRTVMRRTLDEIYALFPR
ncbi:MAG: ATP-binding cassette domain-containing protein, partial [Achromobacter sp.]|nr:ATP-binding cassette domain-containing protein [Achromobacter sp.]